MRRQRSLLAWARHQMRQLDKWGCWAIAATVVIGLIIRR